MRTVSLSGPDERARVESRLAGCLNVQSQKWALGYLGRQIKAYQKGHVPPASVESAARIARESGVWM